MKMKLGGGMRAVIVGAPAGYLDALKPLPEGVHVSPRLGGVADWIQIFVKTKAELAAAAPRVGKALGPDTLVWFSYPKGTSKIQADLTRDKGWEPLNKLGLKWVTLVSVDETWSAFALRPYKPGEKKQTFRL